MDEKTAPVPLELAAAVREAAVQLHHDGRGALAVRLLRRLLDEGAEPAVPAESARWTAALSEMVWVRGGMAEARELAEHAAALAEESGDPTALSEAVFALGEAVYHETAFYGRGEYAASMAHHRRALDLRRAAGDRRGESLSLSRIGVIHERLGEHDRAAKCYEEALQIAGELDFPKGAFRPLVHFGLAKDRAGDLPGALGDHRASLAAARRAHDVHALTFALCNVAETAYRNDRKLGPPLELLREALDLARGMDFRFGLCRVPLMTGEVYAEAGLPEDARREYAEALRVAEEEGFPRFVGYARERLDGLDGVGEEDAHEPTDGGDGRSR